MRCPRCGFTLQDQKFKEKARKHYPRAFEPWTPEENGKLQELVLQGLGLIEMAKELGRQETAIQRRLELLGLKILVKPTETATFLSEEEQIQQIRKGQ